MMEQQHHIINERFAISVFFCTMMGVVLVFSERRFEDVILVIFLATCSIIPIILPKRVKTYGRIDGTMKARKIRFPSWSQMFVILERHFPILKKIRLLNEGVIEKQVRPSGSPHDPEKMATISTRLAMTIFPIVVIIGTIGFLLYSPFFLIGMAMPPIVMMSPLIKLKFDTMERKTRIEEEIAYFLSYVNIMQSVNMNLYNAFKAIRGSTVFPAMEQDASEVVKRVELLGITQNESLDEYAKTHPSKTFGDYVSGYLAKITTVGNTPEYTESKAKYFFDEYLGTWDRYEKSAQEIFGAIIMVAVVLPMMIAFNAVVGSSASAGLMLLIGLVIPPLVSVGMISMLNKSQPSTGNLFSLAPISILPGFVVAIVAIAAGIEFPTALAVGCFVFAFVNYISTKKMADEANTIDLMLPEFMRDVTEMSKTGSNINQIIQTQAERKSYRKQFNNILNDMAMKIRTGVSFDVAAMSIRTKSNQVRFIMFLLARTYVTGGGTADTFFNITQFISAIDQKKRQITKGLMSMSIIVFFAPFLMIGISHIMVGMFAGMDSGQDVDAPALVGAFSSVDNSVLETISLMAVVTSVSMGVVAAKITNYTVKNTFPVAMTALTTILAIYFVPEIMKMVNFGVR